MLSAKSFESAGNNMPASRDDILNAAPGLSESDRLTIAIRLMETLPENQPGLAEDDDLTAELERRSGDLEGSIDWIDLRNELRQRRQYWIGEIN
jgi:hypothetical protein